MSGPVAIDFSGNRVPIFVFNNRQNGKYVAALEIDLTGTYGLKVNNETAIWPGGTTIVPKDKPKCGFDGKLCMLDGKYRY